MELEFFWVLTQNIYNVVDFLVIKENIGLICGLFSLNPFKKFIITGELI